MKKPKSLSCAEVARSIREILARVGRDGALRIVLEECSERVDELVEIEEEEE